MGNGAVNEKSNRVGNESGIWEGNGASNEKGNGAGI